MGDEVPLNVLARHLRRRLVAAGDLACIDGVTRKRLDIRLFESPFTALAIRSRADLRFSRRSSTSAVGVAAVLATDDLTHWSAHRQARPTFDRRLARRRRLLRRRR
ncbi:MAG: hypothetical protein U0235_34885 [Polyangiaceae bacterium]